MQQTTHAKNFETNKHFSFCEKLIRTLSKQHIYQMLE